MRFSHFTSLVSLRITVIRAENSNLSSRAKATRLSRKIDAGGFIAAIRFWRSWANWKRYEVADIVQAALPSAETGWMICGGNEHFNRCIRLCGVIWRHASAIKPVLGSFCAIAFTFVSSRDNNGKWKITGWPEDPSQVESQDTIKCSRRDSLVASRTMMSLQRVEILLISMS